MKTLKGKVRLKAGLIVGLIAGGVLDGAATILVVDNVDGASVDLSHLGDDTIRLEVDDIGAPWFSLLVVVTGDGDPSKGCATIAPSIEDCFSQGGSLVPLIGIENSIYATFSLSTPKLFHFGSSSGLNYGRFDLDGDSVYETVVEFDFIPDAGISGDLITRYAYDDTGAGLDITQAISALSGIPEPNTLFLMSIGGIAFLRRRRVAARGFLLAKTAGTP